MSGGNLYSFEEVKNAVSVRDVLESYGVKIPRRGNIHCISPEHSDDKPSMKVGEKSCYCFSCMKKYSAIDIVMQFENVDSKTSANILNERFHLNLEPIKRVSYEDALPIPQTAYSFLGLEQKTAYYLSKNGEDNKPIYFGLRELYAEDKMLYYDILNGKLQEKVESIKAHEEICRTDLADALVFLNNSDVKEHLTDMEYLDRMGRAIFTVRQYPEEMKVIENDKSIANQITRLMNKFYKREIKPLEALEQEEDIER